MFGHMRAGLCPPLVQSQAPGESHAKCGSSGGCGVGAEREVYVGNAVNHLCSS